MSFRFLVFLPASVIVARYARTFTTGWFKIIPVKGGMHEWEAKTGRDHDLGGLVIGR